MMKFELPYYKTSKTLEIADGRVAGVLTSRSDSYVPEASEQELVERALDAPVGSEPLCRMAEGKKNIVIISSDHTRPVPSRVTMPVLLRHIRRYNPDCDITILVATGMHRPSTRQELEDKYGRDIVDSERIVIHDAYNDDDMVYRGVLPSGGELWINKVAAEADLLVAEGFIEPHFFAGFSGGRKSVLPGIASKKTVLWNHNSVFIADSHARAGILDGNPIHRDMEYAAKQAGLAFILNVVINGDKHVIAAFAGDADKAHRKGCEFVASLARVDAVPADIVVTSNGGYPLDQNIYQTVKGLTAAEACVRQGGVAIICSSCVDGSGGDFFYHLIADAPSAQAAYENLNGISPADTEFDQWEAQILARILVRANVIIVSEHCDPKMITDMHMLHASDLPQAMRMAEQIAGADSRVTVIPDGIAVIVKAGG